MSQQPRARGGTSSRRASPACQIASNTMQVMLGSELHGRKSDVVTIPGNERGNGAVSRTGHPPGGRYRYSLLRQAAAPPAAAGEIVASDIFDRVTERVRDSGTEYGQALLGVAMLGAPETPDDRPALPSLRDVFRRADRSPAIRQLDQHYERSYHESRAAIDNGKRVERAAERARRRKSRRFSALRAWLARIARLLAGFIPDRLRHQRDWDKAADSAAFSAHISAYRASLLFPPGWGLVRQVRAGEYAEPADVVEQIEQGLIRHTNGGSFDAGSLFDQHPGMFGGKRFQDPQELFDALAQHCFAPGAPAPEDDGRLEDEMTSDPDLLRLHGALRELNRRGTDRAGRPGPAISAALCWLGLQRSDGLKDAIDRIEPDQIAHLSGADDAAAWAFWREALNALDRDGYMKCENGHWTLGRRGARIYGQQALNTVLQEMRRADHLRARTHSSGELTPHTHRHRYGERFDPDIAGSLLNAIRRGGCGVPLRLRGDDFAVREYESVRRSATALVVDYSWSMHNSGAVRAADTMAAAMHELIRSTRQRDEIATFAFARNSCEIPSGLLIHGGKIDIDTSGTLLAPALMRALRWLRRHRADVRHITVISDGQISDPVAVLRSSAACRRAAVTVSVVLTEHREYPGALQRASEITGGTMVTIRPEDLPAYVVSAHIAGH